jgi:putative N-acetyltransferase (TIGR04045 family)
MANIYTSVARILRRKGLHSSQSLAGCVRCGACSALKTYELEPLSVICHTARTDEEFKNAMNIRKNVFVHEQGLFKENDRDEHDAICTLLVAKRHGEIVGTVRIYPEGDRHWMGGRLAVKKGHRDSQIGSLLVKEAMKRVKVEGCTCFRAYIQKNNVEYFQSLGWQPLHIVNDHCGLPHQLMQADLSLVSSDI